MFPRGIRIGTRSRTIFPRHLVQPGRFGDFAMVDVLGRPSGPDVEVSEGDGSGTAGYQYYLNIESPLSMVD